MARRKQVRNFSRDVARAPYNFVPLPERIVDVREQYPKGTRLTEALPDHNRYLPDHLSGYFDVTLTTESLTYIRAPQTEAEAEAGEQSPKFFYTRDDGTPLIPGSSLRGMLRAMMEIITFGKIERLNAGQGFYYRAVAAKRDDPLKSSYESVLGRPEDGFGENVRPGYLVSEAGRWFIVPAQPLRNGKWIEKIRNDRDLVGGVRDLIRFNDRDYQLQRYRVIYDDGMTDSKGRREMGVRSPAKGERHTGVLVCSGNMNETGGGKSPRTRYALIGLPDENARPLRITQEAIEAYKLGLSPFQEQQFGSKNGMLEDGMPVFYVQSGRHVVFFGHSPYFRVPATRETEGRLRVASAYDFVPENLRDPRTYDFAEALFGFVRTKKKNDPNALLDPQVKQGDKRRAYAGRVKVTDAVPDPEQRDPFTHTIMPKVLGTPKPTTFQHYLTQESDVKPDLKHYDRNTEIRGHKQYWRQRQRRVENITIPPEDVPRGEMKPDLMTPLKADQRFYFRVYFDNLTTVELGALAWALALPSTDPEQASPYRHMIGMGKAFGMGVIKLEPTLYLVDRLPNGDRVSRYQRLFTQREDGANSWYEAEQKEEWRAYSSVFEAFMLEHLPPEEIHGALSFHNIERIQMLLTMLEGCDPHPELTYMQIEPQNEYKDRPVLPDPMVVAKRLRKRQT